MHFQRKSNLKHIKSLKSTLVYGLHPNVDIRYANPFKIEYFIKLLPQRRKIKNLRDRDTFFVIYFSLFVY